MPKRSGQSRKQTPLNCCLRKVFCKENIGDGRNCLLFILLFIFAKQFLPTSIISGSQAARLHHYLHVCSSVALLSLTCFGSCSEFSFFYFSSLLKNISLKAAHTQKFLSCVREFQKLMKSLTGVVKTSNKLRTRKRPMTFFNPSLFSKLFIL